MQLIICRVCLFLYHFALTGYVMAVISSGRRGDQVMLTSKLYEFEEPLCIQFHYRLQESKPGTSGSLSVYLLSKQRVPVRLRLEEYDTVFAGGWRKGCVYIPSGTYHVMFVATLGLPYHSDIYLDNIVRGRVHRCHYQTIVKPTGIFLLINSA